LDKDEINSLLRTKKIKGENKRGLSPFLYFYYSGAGKNERWKKGDCPLLFQAAWMIYESRLLQMQGADHEAVDKPTANGPQRSIGGEIGS
jgi:hypothetical protein